MIRVGRLSGRNLLRIRRKIDSEPSFLTVVTGMEYAYTRDDRVYVISLGCLQNQRRGWGRPLGGQMIPMSVSFSGRYVSVT